MIHIPLQPHQIEEATEEGLRRDRVTKSLGGQDKYGARLATEEQKLTRSIIGAAAEKAVAYHLDLQWTGKGGEAREGDVENLEVRWSEKPRLLMHPADKKNNRRFVAVTGTLPDLYIIGYFHPSELTDDLWDENLPSPAYNIPEHKLHPAEDLLGNES